MDTRPTPISPCIGICSMNPETGFCRGCYRTTAEIGGWMAVSVDERHRILERVGARREELGADKIEAERRAKRDQRIAERAARRAARAQNRSGADNSP